jgi:hypothetical protein
VAEVTVREAVAACGISFILDEKDAVALASAGASRQLIGILAPPAAAAPGAAWQAPTDGRQMVWAPDGSFQMGSGAAEAGRKDDEPQHAVQIPRGFWLDVNEVSNDGVPALRPGQCRVAKGSDRSPAPRRQLPQGLERRRLPGRQGRRARGVGELVRRLCLREVGGQAFAERGRMGICARAPARRRPTGGATRFDPSHVAPLVTPPAASAFRSPWNTVGMLGGVWEWTSTVYRPYPYRLPMAARKHSPAIAGQTWWRRFQRGALSARRQSFERTARDHQRSPRLPLRPVTRMHLRGAALLGGLCCAASWPAAASQSDQSRATFAPIMRTERAGAGVVRIVYDLNGAAAALFSVALEVSNDGGQSFTVRASALTGDVGPGVSAGSDKVIVWDSAKDIEDLQIERIVFRVRVTQGGSSGMPEPASPPKAVPPAGGAPAGTGSGAGRRRRRKEAVVCRKAPSRRWSAAGPRRPALPRPRAAAGVPRLRLPPLKRRRRHQAPSHEHSPHRCPGR